MLQEYFRQIEFGVMHFKMRQQFKYRPRSFAIVLLARFFIKLLMIRRRSETSAAQEFIKRIGQRRLFEPGAQSLAGKLVVAKLMQETRVFQSGDKLNLAKLGRLKATGRIQLIAKAEKVYGRHGLENMDLPDQHLLDFYHA